MENVEIFESGIDVNEFRFQWKIKNLGHALRVGVEPSASLLSELSIKFSTGNQLGHQSTWQLSLISKGTEESRFLLLKAALTPNANAGITSGVLSDTCSGFYAAVEVESAGEFQLIEKKSHAVKIVLVKISMEPSTIGYAESLSENRDPALLQRPKYPIELCIFRCDKTFFEKLKTENGNLTLFLKFTQMKPYHGVGCGVTGENVALNHNKSNTAEERAADVTTFSSSAPSSNWESSLLKSTANSQKKKEQDLVKDLVQVTQSDAQ